MAFHVLCYEQPQSCTNVLLFSVDAALVEGLSSAAARVRQVPLCSQQNSDQTDGKGFSFSSDFSLVPPLSFLLFKSHNMEMHLRV